MEDLKNLVCPECGDGVFVATISEPGMVMCRDMGHWVGYPSDCKRLTIRAPVPPKQTCPFCKRDFNIIKKDLPKFWCPDNSDGQA